MTYGFDRRGAHGTQVSGQGTLLHQSPSHQSSERGEGGMMMKGDKNDKVTFQPFNTTICYSVKLNLEFHQQKGDINIIEPCSQNIIGPSCSRNGMYFILRQLILV